jgi:hypothetical protein
MLEISNFVVLNEQTMAGLNNEQASQRIYEVVIPEQDAAQRTALFGLASTFNWGIRELTNAPPIPEFITTNDDVTRSTLLTTSQELFGSERYGETALSILERMRKSFTVIPLGTGNNLYAVNIDGDRHVLPIKPVAHKMASPQKIGQSLLEAMDAQCPPFNLEVDEIHTFSGGMRLGVLPAGEAQRTKLARFMKFYSYDRHELTGLLGKAFDVLNHVAGTAEPHATETYDPEDFLRYEDFRIWARERGATTAVLAETNRRLRHAIIQQIWDGRASKTYGGEVVVEEFLDAKPIYIKLSGDEAVAIKSFVQIGSLKGNPRTAKTSPFLRSIPELLKKDQDL